MPKRTLLAAAALIGLAGGLTLAAPATAMTNAFFYGTVDHVSTDNIKVTDPQTGQSLSFMLVPKFKNVTSDDGKTTYTMAFLHPGTKVKVVYDQKMMGMRHADKIIVLKRLPHNK